MKLFLTKQLREAIAYVEEGGQALHLCGAEWIPPGAHIAFQNCREFAHLFDLDTERLRNTAKSLGVCKIKIHKEGTNAQHVDLVSGPLRKAKRKCKL